MLIKIEDKELERAVMNLMKLNSHVYEIIENPTSDMQAIYEKENKTVGLVQLNAFKDEKSNKLYTLDEIKKQPNKVLNMESNDITETMLIEVAKRVPRYIIELEHRMEIPLIVYTYAVLRDATLLHTIKNTLSREKVKVNIGKLKERSNIVRCNRKIDSELFAESIYNIVFVKSITTEMLKEVRVTDNLFYNKLMRVCEKS